MASKYFKNIREPFSVTLTKEKLVILTSPQDVAAAYKNTISLRYYIFVKNILLNFGTSLRYCTQNVPKTSGISSVQEEKKNNTFAQRQSFANGYVPTSKRLLQAAASFRIKTRLCRCPVHASYQLSFTMGKP